MLLRQFHRPPLRSVTAAWRPATTIPAHFQHGSSRASSNITDNDPPREDDQRRVLPSPASSPAPPSPEPPREYEEQRALAAPAPSSLEVLHEVDQQQAPLSPAPSGSEPPHEEDQTRVPPSPATSKPNLPLFEQLFPDEAKRSNAKVKRVWGANAPKAPWVPQSFEEEQASLTLLESLQDGLPDEVISTETPNLTSSAFRAQAVLILSAVSKNLLESDFLRLGAKGKHLDGWVGGILKVIQARNRDTLEPLGHYFILFATREAAALYKDRLEYLWKLGKTYIPRAHHSLSHMIQSPLPRGLRRTENGEDIAELIRSFTLVPPSQRYHIQLSRMNPTKLAELNQGGGLVDQLAARTGTQFLVLIRVDGGRLTVDTLRRAIEGDGIQRNLPWRIKDFDHGILPFGKPIVKENDKADAEIAPNFSSNSSSAQGSKDEAGGQVNDVKQYPRFIVPFMDKAEAHRFVRSWHRRELRVQMGDQAKDQPTWEEVKIINATVLW